MIAANVLVALVYYHRVIELHSYFIAGSRVNGPGVKLGYLMFGQSETDIFTIGDVVLATSNFHFGTQAF